MENAKRDKLIDKVQQLRQTGRTIDEACKQAGVRKATYYNWIYRKRKNGQTKAKPNGKPSFTTIPLNNTEDDTVFFYYGKSSHLNRILDKFNSRST